MEVSFFFFLFFILPRRPPRSPLTSLLIFVLFFSFSLDSRPSTDASAPVAVVTVDAGCQEIINLGRRDEINPVD